ncbi:Dicer [Blattamonas nauphoetae]|uniref:Dicer n=1 Tax=Blattamonas nauphoetae TaxID=2049346 RepID=A0ABQ9XG67_9EUKA|nr:Dicer [Blattamonas nauphoetae]
MQNPTQFAINPPKETLPTIASNTNTTTLHYTRLPLLLKHSKDPPDTRMAPCYSTSSLVFPRSLCPPLLSNLFFGFFTNRSEIEFATTRRLFLRMPLTTFQHILTPTLERSRTSVRSHSIIEPATPTSPLSPPVYQHTTSLKPPTTSVRPTTLIDHDDDDNSEEEFDDSLEELARQEALFQAENEEFTETQLQPDSFDESQRLDSPAFHVVSRMHPVPANKLTCFFHFFNRLHTIYQNKLQASPSTAKDALLSLLPSSMEIHRRSLSTQPRWSSSMKELCRLVVDLDGKIEDTPPSCYKVDFANKVLGGGVLTHGCVQEEILFTLAPEYLTAMLFLEELDSNEAALIVGPERFCKYTGYSGTFAFAGPYTEDQTAEIKSRTVVIDALHFSKHRSRDPTKSQWSQRSILREMNKAFVGFSFVPTQPSRTRGDSWLCTGHWGCGAFNGDPILKFLLQWLAASEVGIQTMQWCGMEMMEEIRTAIALAECLTSSPCGTTPQSKVSICTSNPQLVQDFEIHTHPPQSEEDACSSMTVGDLYKAIILYITNVEKSENRDEIHSGQGLAEMLLTDLTTLNEEQSDMYKIQLRDYQIEVLSFALKQNAICFLDTGSGKTMIAIQLIKQLLDQHAMSNSHQHKVAVFLAPMVLIAEQHFSIACSNLNYRCGLYHGDRTGSLWDRKQWQAEIRDHDLMIFTGQIFHDILQHAYISLNEVLLIIFDECHHTQRDDVYSKIMNNFYHRFPNKDALPRILGLTASPCIRVKGLEDQLQVLETIFNAKLVTPSKYSRLLRLYAPKPEEIVLIFRNSVKEKYSHLWTGFHQKATILHESALTPSPDGVIRLSVENNPDDIAVRFLFLKTVYLRLEEEFDSKDKNDRIRRSILHFSDFYETFGSWGILTVVRDLLRYGPSVQECINYVHTQLHPDKPIPNIDPSMLKLIRPMTEKYPSEHFNNSPLFAMDIDADRIFSEQAKQKRTISEQGSIMRFKILVRLMGLPDDPEQITRLRISAGHLPPKLRAFIALLVEKRAEMGQAFKALVLCQQRDTATLLCRLFKQSQALRFIFHPRTLIGQATHMTLNQDQSMSDIDALPGIPASLNPSSKLSAISPGMKISDQKQIVKFFHSKFCNLLFATSVGEEGLDIQACNIVVRFDSFVTLPQYLQSRGRARSRNGYYVHIVAEDGKQQFQEKLQEYHDAELSQGTTAKKHIRGENLEKAEYSTDVQIDDVNRIEENKWNMESPTGAYLVPSAAVSLLVNLCTIWAHLNHVSSNSDELIKQTIDDEQTITVVTLPDTFTGFGDGLTKRRPLRVEKDGQIVEEEDTRPEQFRFKVTDVKAKKSSRRIACMKALMELYSRGFLDHSFIPSFRHEAEQEALPEERKETTITEDLSPAQLLSKVTRSSFLFSENDSYTKQMQILFNPNAREALSSSASSSLFSHNQSESHSVVPFVPHCLSLRAIRSSWFPSTIFFRMPPQPPKQGETLIYRPENVPSVSNSPLFANEISLFLSVFVVIPTHVIMKDASVSRSRGGRKLYGQDDGEAADRFDQEKENDQSEDEDEGMKSTDTADRLKELFDVNEDEKLLVDVNQSQQLRRSVNTRPNQHSVPLFDSLQPFDPEPLHPLPFTFPFGFLSHSIMPASLEAVPFELDLPFQLVQSLNWHAEEIESGIAELTKRRTAAQLSTGADADVLLHCHVYLKSVAPVNPAKYDQHFDSTQNALSQKLLTGDTLFPLANVPQRSSPLTIPRTELSRLLLYHAMLFERRSVARYQSVPLHTVAQCPEQCLGEAFVRRVYSSFLHTFDTSVEGQIEATTLDKMKETAQLNWNVFGRDSEFSLSAQIPDALCYLIAPLKSTTTLTAVNSENTPYIMEPPFMTPHSFSIDWDYLDSLTAPHFFPPSCYTQQRYRPFHRIHSQMSSPFFIRDQLSFTIPPINSIIIPKYRTKYQKQQDLAMELLENVETSSAAVNFARFLQQSDSDRLQRVVKHRLDLTPASPFPDQTKAKTFADYFRQTYGVEITDMNQHLVETEMVNMTSAFFASMLYHGPHPPRVTTVSVKQKPKKAKTKAAKLKQQEKLKKLREAQVKKLHSLEDGSSPINAGDIDIFSNPPPFSQRDNPIYVPELCETVFALSVFSFRRVLRRFCYQVERLCVLDAFVSFFTGITQKPPTTTETLQQSSEGHSPQTVDLTTPQLGASHNQPIDLDLDEEPNRLTHFNSLPPPPPHNLLSQKSTTSSTSSSSGDGTHPFVFTNSTQDHSSILDSMKKRDVLLESLTMHGTGEFLDLERLEFLGDSVLLLITNMYLFGKHLNKKEGELSSLKDKMVSNFFLFNQAMDTKPRGYFPSFLITTRNGSLNWGPPLLPRTKILWDPRKEEAMNDWDNTFREHKLYESHDHKPFSGQYSLFIPAKGSSPDAPHSPPYAMSTKKIADSVEALLGACYVLGDYPLVYDAWLHFLKVTTPQELSDSLSNLSRSLSKPSKPPNIAIEKYMLDYQFHPNHKHLLTEALTHQSAMATSRIARPQSYERLEYIGDTVLAVLTVDMIYRRYQHASPALMTVMKHALVSNSILAVVSTVMHLNRNIIHQSEVILNDNRNYEENLRRFFSVQTVQSIIDGPQRETRNRMAKLLDPMNGKFNLSILDLHFNKAVSDVFESTLGAVFIDAAVSAYNQIQPANPGGSTPMFAIKDMTTILTTGLEKAKNALVTPYLVPIFNTLGKPVLVPFIHPAHYLYKLIPQYSLHIRTICPIVSQNDAQKHRKTDYELKLERDKIDAEQRLRRMIEKIRQETDILETSTDNFVPPHLSLREPVSVADLFSHHVNATQADSSREVLKMLQQKEKAAQKDFEMRYSEELSSYTAGFTSDTFCVIKILLPSDEADMKSANKVKRIPGRLKRKDMELKSTLGMLFNRPHSDELGEDEYEYDSDDEGASNPRRKERKVVVRVCSKGINQYQAERVAVRRSLIAFFQDSPIGRSLPTSLRNAILDAGEGTVILGEGMENATVDRSVQTLQFSEKMGEQKKKKGLVGHAATRDVNLDDKSGEKTSEDNSEDEEEEEPTEKRFVNVEITVDDLEEMMGECFTSVTASADTGLTMNIQLDSESSDSLN